MKTIHDFSNWIIVQDTNNTTRFGKLANDLMFDKASDDTFRESFSLYRARGVKYMAMALVNGEYTAICGKDTSSIESVEANVQAAREHGIEVGEWFPVEFE